MALTDGEAQADGSGDIQILLAAQITEALAVTTYTNIIATNSSPASRLMIKAI